MAARHWLVKSDPDTYSWPDLVRDRQTRWDGVRNHQARLHLLAMAAGDSVLVYHSQEEKAVVGIAEVTRTAYRDPTSEEDRWVAVDLAAGPTLACPVTLAAIKADPSLAEIALVKQSRLSVMPLTAGQYQRILALGAGSGKGTGAGNDAAAPRGRGKGAGKRLPSRKRSP